MKLVQKSDFGHVRKKHTKNKPESNKWNQQLSTSPQMRSPSANPLRRPQRWRVSLQTTRLDMDLDLTTHTENHINVDFHWLTLRSSGVFDAPARHCTGVAGAACGGGYGSG